MSFPRYPEYKDSGVEWLGKIPTHWELFALKRAVLLKSGETIGPDAIEEAGDFPVYGGNGFRGYTSSFTHDGEFALIGRQGALCGNVNYAKGQFWASEHAVVATPKKHLATRWLGELLRTMSLGQYSVSAAQPGLSVEIIGNLHIPFPPPTEQAAIAAFLDRETAKIDALVAEREKLIALLQEKRQAVISHAVTKGLNPAAPMKDSGIEWLGEVPAHWDVMPLKSCVEYQEGPGILAVDFYDEGVPLLRVSGVQSRWASLEGCNFLNPQKVEKQWRHFRLVCGDLLISASASMGSVCEVDENTEGAIPYTGLIRFRGQPGVMSNSFVRSFLVSSFFVTQIDLFKAGATIQHFGPTHLSQMKIARPPLDEQKEIALFVDAQTLRFQELIIEAQKAVVLLQERRSALISAAVTGKIDVRGLVAKKEAA